MNSCSDVILPRKKFTWADLGGINTDIHPRLYAPAPVTPQGRPNNTRTMFMVSWASSEDIDTAGRRGNPGQLETDVAERGGTWTSWRVVATDHSCIRVMMRMRMMRMMMMMMNVYGAVIMT